MSIRKKKDTGKFQVMYRDHQGRQRAKNFTLKTDAEKFERETKLAMERGTYTDPSKGKSLLKDVYAEWFRTKQDLTPKSQTFYKSLWNIHISPTFGESPIKTITAHSINQWALAKATGPNASTSTGRIEKAQELIATLLDYCVDLNLIPKNVARKANGKVNKLKVNSTDRKRPATALTPKELLKLANATNEFRPLILVMGLCGLRWGEAIALRPMDIDPVKGIILISRSISEVEGKFTIQDTKTHKSRVVVVPEMLRDELMLLSISKPVDELLFSRNGEYLKNSMFHQYVYKPAIKQAGIPKVTLHDLRHTTASIAIANGANVLVLARMLGHSTPTMTLNTYGHMFKEDLESVAKSINDSILKVMV
jgi:integrase